MSGGDDVKTNTTYQDDTNGPIVGGQIGYEGGNLNMQNAGMFNPQELNPSAGGYVNNLNDLYQMYLKSSAGSAFNPEYYDPMKQTSQANVTTSLKNQYASLGLSGSSAEIGSLNNAVNQNEMGWMNRMQSDQMKALQGLSGLNSAGYSETTGIQNQYQNFEDAYNQTIANILGLQAGQQESNNSNWAGIIGAGLGAGGMAAGGR